MRISTIVSALERAAIDSSHGYRRRSRNRQTTKFRRRIVSTYETMMHRLIDVSSERTQYAMMLGQREQDGK